MADGATNLLDQARAEAYATPLDQIDLSVAERFRDNTLWPFFERIRKEDPVHWTASSAQGPYWSITRFQDIMAVETNHQVFSSAQGITIEDEDNEHPLPMFIAMDPPKHDAQRKVVSPIVSPHNLANLEPIIRERAGKILDELPIGEPFNWVDRVSVELTTQMLATLFDFPFEDRRKLTRWSDLVTAGIDSDIVESQEAAWAEIQECAGYFTNLWNQRVNQAVPGNDLISMMANAEATKNMEPMEFLGNILLLIVGGNDTTRNSLSGGLLALNENPDQYQKLRDHPELIPSMVSEIIRWQTPVAHMRRTATSDFELGGKTIKKGDKVVMWYVSGNRDETEIDNPEAFIIDRERPRHHVSFGYGIHRCVGNRMAEMQLRIVWEEILKRFPEVQVVGEPRRATTNFLRAYQSMTALIPARA
jgi:cytochrome P450